ncbi:type I-E CRISPR-associated protein Cas5/CasD [Amycolatopsis taiwanensis]|uniref:type I-E CRISPR-associated protein Cas5/CasD n=1 Tax=Amycolatopsis taiwanensis TaxID=342230 RepID=UPI0004B0FFB8|nr:type I-E CRISPR-associated protein Cas5/CasD [Amycolatopsis taiwanensis]
MPVPTSLALCFDAPMQSWGVDSRFVIRDTAAEPTKSGVVGLLAAALGVQRHDDKKVADLANLRMGVRVDREGIVERDYHTTQNVPTTEGTGHRTVVSNRYYLADALFLVVLEGDRALLASLHAAVQRPHWPLSFGRKAFLPARPLVASASSERSELLTAVGLTERALDDVLRQHPWLEIREDIRRHEKRKIKAGEPTVDLRTLTDCKDSESGAEPRRDHPLSFAHRNRRFTTRSVLANRVPLTMELIRPGEPACS